MRISNSIRTAVMGPYNFLPGLVHVWKGASACLETGMIHLPNNYTCRIDTFLFSALGNSVACPDPKIRSHLCLSQNVRIQICRSMQASSRSFCQI